MAALALVACLVALSVALPSGFIGSWSGIPYTTVVGPWNVAFNFTIEELDDGWLMSDAFDNEGALVPDSWQNFYVSNDTLLYCGVLNNFFPQSAPIEVWFTLMDNMTTATNMTWCSTRGGCNFAQWYITLVDMDHITTEIHIYLPSLHFHADLVRVPSSERRSERMRSVLPQQCNFTAATERRLAGYESPLACPKALAAASAKKQADLALTRPPRDSAYAYCYNINPAMDYTIEWSVDLTAQTLSMRVSAAADTHQWIGIGFAPNWPGMIDGDIVLGYLTGGGQSCVRSMYAVEYVGPPEDSTSMPLTNTSISAVNGRLVMTFTRSLNSGHTPIPTGPPQFPNTFGIMFATGPPDVVLRGCHQTPSYHGNTRGYRKISFVEPTKVFPDFSEC